MKIYKIEKEIQNFLIDVIGIHNVGQTMEYFDKSSDQNLFIRHCFCKLGNGDYEMPVLFMSPEWLNVFSSYNRTELYGLKRDCVYCRRILNFVEFVYERLCYKKYENIEISVFLYLESTYSKKMTNQGSRSCVFQIVYSFIFFRLKACICGTGL